ncbi:universal stress protein [Streptomyces sp. NPDC007991]|uniref:universal stress protein n=1 Tax=Streptomyces sp. NPDC007991 TaxID=3364803 RepID=UPI0036EB36C9
MANRPRVPRQLGSRGMGSVVGLMVGSTAVHLAAHGQCPVLVVREHGQSRADRGGRRRLPAGAGAVDFAFTEAEAYPGVSVTHEVVTAATQRPQPPVPEHPASSPAFG